MPYIKQEKRKELKDLLDLMIEKDLKADGDINYLLYSYCVKQIKPSYNNYKNYIGELRQCANEIERRLLDKYEDKKIKENGDINKNEV